jgi:membrane protein YqaA with SNARE-associated domain
MDDSSYSAVLDPSMEALEAPPRERAPAGLRAWFAGFLLWTIGLSAVALIAFGRYEAGDAAAMRPWLLALMCLYLTLCNTLLPLPTAWVILLVASDEVGLFEAAWLRVVLVAGLGGLATMMANLNEYHLLSYLFHFGLARRIRRSRVYRWGVRWFDVSPFRTLTLIAFVPIPIDAVRWLAILRGYSRWRFGLAYLLGRLPRYALLAGLSVGLRLDTWGIIAVQVGLVVLLVARLAWTMIRRLTRGRAEPRGPAEEVVLEEAAGASASQTPTA